MTAFLTGGTRSRNAIRASPWVAAQRLPKASGAPGAGGASRLQALVRGPGVMDLRAAVDFVAGSARESAKGNGAARGRRVHTVSNRERRAGPVSLVMPDGERLAPVNSDSRRVIEKELCPTYKSPRPRVTRSFAIFGGVRWTIGSSKSHRVV